MFSWFKKKPQIDNQKLATKQSYVVYQIQLTEHKPCDNINDLIINVNIMSVHLTLEQAELELVRLTELNKNPDINYFWQAARILSNK